MTLATSSTAVKRQPPLLPQTLPTTQAGWTQFVTQMQEWYQSLQSLQSSPNVLPAQYTVFQQNGLPPFVASGCTVSQDATHTLYAAQSLKVLVSGSPATLALTGFPIAIQPGQLWYCAFEVFGPYTGSITLSTNAGATVSSGLATTGVGWNLVWTLLDLTAFQDTQATWTLSFPPGTFWLDGLQMSPAGNPFLQQPPFVVGTGSVPAGSSIGFTPAPGSITGGTGGMIAPVTITGVNIAPVTITADLIAPVAITAAQIAPLTITAAQIANNTISAGQIQANSITAGQIAANTITSQQIAAATILADRIAANTITALQIAANTITAAQIAALTITANQIAANTITSSQIAANTITTNQIAAGTILANNIAANTITGGKIAANTITSTNLSVTTLSAITANLGTITAGTIIFDNGVYMRVQGNTGFGTTGDIIDWYGPHLASTTSCSKTNALFYLALDGTAYFAGGTASSIGLGIKHRLVQNTTEVIPAGVSACVIELWGVSGAGFGNASPSSFVAGGGGGSGAYSRTAMSVLGQAGRTFTLVLPAGNATGALNSATITPGTVTGFAKMTAPSGYAGAPASGNTLGTAVSGVGGGGGLPATGGSVVNVGGNSGLGGTTQPLAGYNTLYPAIGGAAGAGLNGVGNSGANGNITPAVTAGGSAVAIFFYT